MTALLVEELLTDGLLTEGRFADGRLASGPRAAGWLRTSVPGRAAAAPTSTPLRAAHVPCVATGSASGSVLAWHSTAAAPVATNAPVSIPRVYDGPGGLRLTRRGVAAILALFAMLLVASVVVVVTSFVAVSNDPIVPAAQAVVTVP